MKKTYDLTTRKGLTSAAKLVGNVAFGGGLLGPVLGYAIDKISDMFDTDKSIEKQSEIVRKLVAAGRDQDLEELHVKLDKKAGVNLGSSIEGVPINVGYNNDGSIEITAKYNKKSRGRDYS